MYEIMEQTQTEKVDVAGGNVDYVVLLNKSVCFAGKKAYDYLVCGESLASWVCRACGKQPTKIELDSDGEFFDVLRPALGESKYTVVLYSDTPLLTKNGVSQMLDYAVCHNLDVARFERAWIFKTEMLKKQNMFASKTLDINKNELFVVDSVETLAKAQRVLKNRILKYHMTNGAIIVDPESTYIDASVTIEPGAIIEPFVKIDGKSFVGANSKICSNSVVSSSKIDERAIVKNNCNIVGSMVLDNAIVGNHCLILNKSVVGEESIVSASCTLDQTTTNSNCKIGVGCVLLNTKLANSVSIEAGTKCLGSDVFDIKIASNATIGANCTLCAGACVKQDAIVTESSVVKGK